MAYGQPDESIPLSVDELSDWWDRVDLAIEARRPHAERWDELLKAYLPSASADAINSNTHFRNTEQKKAALFFRTPDLILAPLEPLKDQTQGPDGQAHDAQGIIAIKQAVLNKLLGRDGVNAKRLMDEVLFDILQPAGKSPTKICYEADFVEVEQQVQVGEEPAGGSVLGLQTVPVYKTEKVPVPVHEEWAWRRFSPKKLLIPHDWHSTRYDDAAWIGMQFVKPLALAIREYGLPEDFEANTTHDPHVFEAGKTKADGKSSAPLVEGVEVWYRPAFFPKTGVTHRQVQRRLVLIRQLEDRPAKHTISPYQTIGPDGRLTPDSMIGFPIHVFTLRDLSDSAYVPSDAAMTDPLVKQKNTWRSQDIKRRDANIPRFLYDGSIKEALEKLKDADVGEGAEVEAGKLAQGIDSLIAELPKLEKAVADVQGEQSIERDIQETLALGPNQGGGVNSKVLSATEISTAQSNANVRGEAEQNRLLGDFLVGVRKFDALVTRFADTPDYVEWVGQDGTKRLSAWNGKMLAARFAYDAKPDSQLHIDVAQDRQQWIQFANIVSNAPEVNRLEVMRKLAEKFGQDGTKLIQPPPPKQAEAASGSVSIKPEDFIGPQAPAAQIIARAIGIEIPDDVLATMGVFGQLWAQMQAAAAAQQQQAESGVPAETEHGGALEGSEGGLRPISKHAGEMTGAPVGRGPM